MKYLVTLFFILCLHVNTFANTAITFTPEEKQWLATHKTILAGIDHNFAPFEFVDKKGNLQGITADYLAELSRILGVEFDITKEKNWNAVNEFAKQGKVDIIPCIVSTDQRRKYLNFTDPYLSFPMVIVTNKNTGFVNGIKELENKAVAVIDNYTPHQILEKYYPDIHLVKTKDLKMSLELVASGRTFAHVGNLSRVVYLLKEQGFQNLSISGITQYKYNFAIGIKKSDPILNSIIQKAYNAIPQKFHDDIYYKWFPPSYKEAKDYSLVIYISLAAALIILIILVLNRRLKRKVKRSVVIEKQLSKNVKWLNKSLKKANVGAWNWDLRTNTITGNSVYAHILGLEDDEIQIAAKDFQKNFIHPEDLSIVLTELENYFNGTVKDCSAQFRIRTKDGRIIKIESVGEIFQYDSFNNPVVLFGFIKVIED